LCNISINIAYASYSGGASLGCITEEGEDDIIFVKTQFRLNNAEHVKE